MPQRLPTAARARAQLARQIRAGAASSAATAPRTWCACAADRRRALARAPYGARSSGATSHERPFVNALGALTGNQAMQKVQGRAQGDLPVGLAGRRRREPRRRDVPRPDALPGRQRARRSCAGSTTRCGAPTRSEHAEGNDEHRLVRADRRRRRGRLRRGAQRLRADEADDRGRRRRRALRGPAVVGEEVRPHGRQGARADPGRRQQARRRAPRRRRVRRADACWSRAPTPTARSC